MTLQRLRTVARVGARALVVAGFAGGVWLFSSAAAHASAPAAAPTMKTQPALTPATRLRLETRPSLIPNTDARSQPPLAPGAPR